MSIRTDESAANTPQEHLTAAKTIQKYVHECVQNGKHPSQYAHTYVMGLDLRPRRMCTALTPKSLICVGISGYSARPNSCTYFVARMCMNVYRAPFCTSGVPSSAHNLAKCARFLGPGLHPSFGTSSVIVPVFRRTTTGATSDCCQELIETSTRSSVSL